MSLHENIEQLERKQIDKAPCSISKTLCLKHLLKETLTGEMSHAVLEVFYSPHYLIKAHLVLFLVITFSLASYSTLSLILNYLEYGVTTTTRTINETPVEFPKITICNINPFTSAYGFSFLRDLNIQNFGFDLFEIDWNAVPQYSETYYFYAFRLYYIGIAVASKLNKTQQRMLSHTLEEVLFICKFNQETCSADDFSWHFDPYYGNCWSFNSGLNSTGHSVDVKQSFMAGSAFGLQLEIYVNSYERLVLFNSATAGNGLLVRVDNKSHQIDHLNDGIRVSSSHTTYLSLMREFKRSLPKPYSDCDLDPEKPAFDSDLYALIRRSKYDYTQSFCLEQCMQEMLIQECNCSLEIFASLFDAPPCVDIFDCVFDTYLNDYNKDYVQNICLPRCPLECNSSIFTYSTTFQTVSGDYHANLIKANANFSSDFINRTIDASTARESVVLLYVFYDLLSYKLSVESPQWDIVSLIANIGGNLGLFLGVSMFSLCEMLTTLFEIYFWKRDNRKVFDSK